MRERIRNEQHRLKIKSDRPKSRKRAVGAINSALSLKWSKR